MNNQINWKVRFSNKQWVASFVSQLLLLAQMCTMGLSASGAIDWQWTQSINEWVILFADGVLVLLAMMGIVQDPTTSGLGDSEQALEYDQPKI